MGGTGRFALCTSTSLSCWPRSGADPDATRPGGGPMAQPTITHIKDLTPDPANARQHNPRNVGMIQDALQEVGAARSIVIDEAGTILAGNATVEAAAAAGITRVQVV